MARRPGVASAPPFTKVLHERTREMRQAPVSEGRREPVPDGTVVVRAGRGACFAGVAHALEVCPYKGIGVWKVPLVLSDEDDAECGRVELRFPKAIGTECRLGDFSLVHAVLLETSSGGTVALSWRNAWMRGQLPPVCLEESVVTSDALFELLNEGSLEQEDGSPERALVTELPAAQLASLPPDALRARGIEDLQAGAR